MPRIKTTISTAGFKELDAALVELPKSTARNVLARAGTKALTPMRDASKRNAPKDDGELADSITIQREKAKRVKGSKRFSAQTGVSLLMGPAPASAIAKANAGWQEDGTVNMPANPYQRTAWDQEVDGTLGILKDELRTEIGKARARIARKAARGQ